MTLYLCALFHDDGQFLTAGTREAESMNAAAQKFEAEHDYVSDRYGPIVPQAYQLPFSLQDLSRAKAWLPDSVTEQDEHYDVFGTVEGEDQHVLACYEPLETRVVMSTLRHELRIPCRIYRQQSDDTS
jgi:hypothetical protein